MGNIIPLRRDNNLNEEQVKNEDSAESLFFDVGETSSNSDSDSKEDEESLVNLKKEMKVAKETLLVLLKTPVNEEDTEAFIKWSEDVQKARNKYKELMRQFNSDTEMDEEIEEQIRNLETVAMFEYTSYKNDTELDDASKKEEANKTITDNNLVPLVETQVTNQSLQGNYVQPQPNTSININFNNGKLESHQITEAKVDPTFLQNAVYDVKKAVGHGIRTVIRRGISILIIFYASTFGTLFINQWFGFNLQSKIIKYMKLIPLYDEILQLVNTIINDFKGL